MHGLIHVATLRFVGGFDPIGYNHVAVLVVFTKRKRPVENKHGRGWTDTGFRIVRQFAEPKRGPFILRLSAQHDWFLSSNVPLNGPERTQ